jgi:cytochrome P450
VARGRRDGYVRRAVGANGRQILNFMVLGHDTTACTLVWALDTLSRREDLQGRLREEVKSLKEKSWTEVDRMHFLENFLREVLRVHCPGMSVMVMLCNLC